MPDEMPTVSDATAQFIRRFIYVILRHLTTIVLVLGALWIVARPHAEEFVRDTVSREKFATQRSLESIDGRQKSLEASVYQLKEQLAAQERRQERMNADLNFLKELQTEQRQDTKRILRGLNRLEAQN